MQPEQNRVFVALLFNSRNRIRFAMDDKLKPLGITDATWRALYFLRQEGDGVQQKELARTMGIEGPSLVRLLDSLSAKGLIERRTDPNDRRGKTIHLTQNAAPLLLVLDQNARQVYGELLADVSDREIQAGIGIFKKILGIEVTA